MEGKIAVFGNRDFVMPFSVFGVDAYVTGTGREEILEKAGKIIDGGYVLVIVAENVAETAEEVFSAKHNVATPAILVVPSTTESAGFATEVLGEALKMATGINILQSV